MKASEERLECPGRRRSEQPGQFCQRRTEKMTTGCSDTEAFGTVQHSWDRGPSGEVKGQWGSGIAQEQ